MREAQDQRRRVGTAEIVTLDALRAVQEAQRSSRLFRAATQSLGVLSVGVALYSGWFAYKFANDANISLRNSMGSVLEMDFPGLSPYMATEECSDVLWTLWGGPDEDPDYAKKYGYLDVLGMFGGLSGIAAKQIKAGMSESAASKMTKWRATAAKIDPETGAFHGYSGEYYWALKVQDELVRTGFIDKASLPKQHIVDQVAGFVTGNKWYWGVTLGAAAVPLVMVTKDILGEYLKNERGENC